MSACSPRSLLVTACTCGCGTVALHVIADDLPAIRIVMPAQQANDLAMQTAVAAQVALSTRNESHETVDQGISEARH